MSRIYGKKRALLGIVASLAIAAVAIAYWTAGGSGTATAPVQGAQDPLTTTDLSALTAMFPGDTAQPIKGTVNNPDNDASIYVTDVVASISSVTSTGTCDASDFTLSNATMTVGQQVASGGSVQFSGATIKFNNKPTTNQDGCQGATVNLAYDVN